jgi:hypothetical protein
MGKGEWVSLFATIAIGGLAYWISGPKLAGASIVVGIGGLVLMHFFGKKKPDGQESSPKADASGIGNAAAAGSSIAAGRDVILYPPSQPVPLPPPPITPALRIPKEVVLEIGKVKPMYLSHDEYGTWYEANSRTNVFGLVLPIYYNPTKSELRTDLYMKAHLVFTEKEIDAGERTIVEAACWIDEYLNHVWFKPGAERRILLAVIGNQKAVALHNRLEHQNAFYESKDGVRMLELSLDSKSVELVLMWESRTVVHHFDLPRLDSFTPPQ